MNSTKKGLSKEALRKNRTNLVVGLVVILVVVVLISVIGWIVMKPEAEVIQGEVEANEVRVSGKLAGRIAQLYVEEGDSVQAGDTLVLFNSPELMAKLSQAEAAEAAARAQELKAQKGARQELIQAAYELWQKALIGEDIARKSYERVKQLFENGVIAAQKFDEAEAQYKAALSTTKAAKINYDMAKNGAEREDKLAARALVDRAKGAVSEVEAYLPETMLTAPISGEVADIYPKVGELVGQGAPVMTLVDLKHCWITFNIREDQLAGMKTGQLIKASIPALGLEPATFKVSYIKAMGSYATWKATKTTGEYDRKTFEVRAKPVQPIDGLRPGMSVLLETEGNL
jgi:HlyD family secretion protein